MREKEVFLQDKTKKNLDKQFLKEQDNYKDGKVQLFKAIKETLIRAHMEDQRKVVIR